MWRINYIVPFVKKHQFDEKGKFDLAKHVIEAYKEIKPIKSNGRRTVGSDTKELLKSVDITFDFNSNFIYFIDTKKTIAVAGNILSNFTLDYDKVIHGSFNTLKENSMGEDEYGSEAKLVCEGVEILVDRIINKLQFSNLEEEKKEKHIAYFKRMLNCKAEHLDEGLQRILFFNQIMWQTRHRLNGLGRLDKILDDLYLNDIDLGVITEEKAHNLINDFLNQLSKYADYKSDALQGDIGQIIILGGLNTDESYFSNKLTEIFLIEQANLKKPDPKTFLRVSYNMPESLLKLAIKCLNAQTGSPLFSNDDVVIPQLCQFGITKDDAYSYCTSACWEPFIVGKSFDQNNISVYDYFVALDEILNEGKFTSFTDLVEKYIERNNIKFEEFLTNLNDIRWAKDPLVSIFTNNCSETRKDISEGGCEHKDYGITTVALSNVIDSLFNIKKYVFDDKSFDMNTLNEARITNFKDQEIIYKLLQQASKHYGHNDKEVIDCVNKITDSMSKITKRYYNPLGGTVKFGLSSPGYNILSKKSSADLSGRKIGMPYNTHISCMDVAYTEVVNFASKLKYDNSRFNGNVVDFFTTSTFLEENFDKFFLFMKGAIKQGFFQMQMNIMNSKILIEAKKSPDRYPGLIVRVWGFSAYFKDLPESYMDLLIERAIAAESAMQ